MSAGECSRSMMMKSRDEAETAAADRGERLETKIPSGGTPLSKRSINLLSRCWPVASRPNSNSAQPQKKKNRIIRFHPCARRVRLVASFSNRATMDPLIQELKFDSLGPP